MQVNILYLKYMQKSSLNIRKLNSNNVSKGYYIMTILVHLGYYNKKTCRLQTGWLKQEFISHGLEAGKFMIKLPSDSCLVIQVYAPTSNTEEAEVERFYEDLQRPFRTNIQRRCHFHYRGLECKSRKSRFILIFGKTNTIL